MYSAFRNALVAAFALTALSAAAVDMTDGERAELRQRAETLQAQRVQNPGPTGDVPLGRPQGDVRLDRDRGEVKARPKSANRPRSTRAGKSKHRRSLRDLPGALVRGR